MIIVMAGPAMYVLFPILLYFAVFVGATRFQPPTVGSLSFEVTLDQCLLDQPPARRVGDKADDSDGLDERFRQERGICWPPVR